ncbi:hypothetical protein [uncultured Polaribacter sp.]|uniref:hypothetical protein n=1 Tax=uncultured Polaribacter sp. TaxID=174711 RepID=UPI002606DA4A|nr:hypothetical protein [uncultured Polaribacter sp.]
MVRLITCFILVFLLQSCFCISKVKNTEFGYVRKKEVDKYNFDAKLFQKLDTFSLYEELLYYKYYEKTFERDQRNGKTFLRFYNNGKFSYFPRIGYDSKQLKLISNYRLTRNDFNPLKSLQGYYYNNHNELFAKTIVRGDGCRAQKNIKNLTVKGDTIILSSKKDKIKKYYVKRRTDKELLAGWKPDW